MNSVDFRPRSLHCVVFVRFCPPVIKIPRSFSRGITRNLHGKFRTCFSRGIPRTPTPQGRQKPTADRQSVRRFRCPPTSVSTSFGDEAAALHPHGVGSITGATSPKHLTTGRSESQENSTNEASSTFSAQFAAHQFFSRPRRRLRVVRTSFAPRRSDQHSLHPTR